MRGQITVDVNASIDVPVVVNGTAEEATVVSDEGVGPNVPVTEE